MIPQVAILGARGIGQVHARIFHKSGANVCAILGSSMRTTQKTVELLHQTLGISPKPFDNLETLIQETQLDALSICTPVECHFKQILTAFDKGLPVFCEKPLFWEKNLSPETLETQINLISEYQGRRLLLNTSNAYFMENVLGKMKRPSTIKSFSFKFYTQGPHRGKDIALDLMPHGFSLLTSLLGYKKITGVLQKVEPNSYQCQFSYEDCKVSFDFREKKDGLNIWRFRLTTANSLGYQRGREKLIGYI